MSCYYSGSDTLSTNFYGSELKVVHGQGTMDVSDWLLVHGQGTMDVYNWLLVHGQGTMDVSTWLLVPSPGVFLGPQTWP